MSKASREKGIRRERQIVELHRAIGIKASRVPLSGAVRYCGDGTDVTIWPQFQEAPLHAEVKARADGQGFKTLERWMAGADLLILCRDRADPLVLLPWQLWEKILKLTSRGDKQSPPST